MSEFKDCIEVMKRIESVGGNKEGKMLVKGTIIMNGEETVHSSLDNTTSASISRSLVPLVDICTSFIRTLDPTEKVEFLRVNFKSRDTHTEVMVGSEADFQAVVVQEHPIRDLRVRSSKQQKNAKGYRHVQQNPFYPSIDGLEPTHK